MVSYNSTDAGYQVVGYGSVSDGYSVKTNSWKKSSCCGSFKFTGQRCSDCPG
jgi:hypothetical protein